MKKLRSSTFPLFLNFFGSGTEQPYNPSGDEFLKII